MNSEDVNFLKKIVNTYPKLSALGYSFAVCYLFAFLRMDTNEDIETLFTLIGLGLGSRYLFMRVLSYPLGHIELTKYSLIGAILAVIVVSATIKDYVFMWIATFNLFALLF